MFLFVVVLAVFCGVFFSSSSVALDWNRARRHGLDWISVSSGTSGQDTAGRGRGEGGRGGGG